MQPPFYAQQMAATHHQPLLVESSCDAQADLDITATRNEAGDTLVLHVVHDAATDGSLSLNLLDFGPVGIISYTVLSGPEKAENTPDSPFRHIPSEGSVDVAARLPLKPYSYTVFVIASK